MTEKKEREDKEENAATEAKLDRRSQHAPCWWNDIGATNTLAPKKVGTCWRVNYTCQTFSLLFVGLYP